MKTGMSVPGRAARYAAMLRYCSVISASERLSRALSLWVTWALVRSVHGYCGSEVTIMVWMPAVALAARARAPMAIVRLRPRRARGFLVMACRPCVGAASERPVRNDRLDA